MSGATGETSNLQRQLHHPLQDVSEEQKRQQQNQPQHSHQLDHYQQYQHTTTTSTTSPGHSSYLSPIVSSCQHLLLPNGSIVGRHVAKTILPNFPSLCSAIPAEHVFEQRRTLGLCSIDGCAPVSHSRIRDFILRDFGPTLHRMGFGRGHRVALVLPNGPELAMAILATCHWMSCVPLNACGAKSELEADLLRCAADLVIGPYHASLDDGMSVASSDHSLDHFGGRFHVLPVSKNKDSAEFMAFEHVEETAKRLGIPFLGLVPSQREAGIFQLMESAVLPISVSSVPRRMQPQVVGTSGVTDVDRPGGMLATMCQETTNCATMVMETASCASDFLDQTADHSMEDSPDAQVSHFLANHHSDEVLVLFTSGTTGSKKIVAHNLGDMLVASAIIALSWSLTPDDINCNMMPLFHVGGIVRQVFSPILSGGSVICCPAFDPAIFWALLQNRAFSWYYAAPTMHHLILQTGKEIITDIHGNRTTLHASIQPRLRMIANAAGGLLPSLARELQHAFHANVLPSYGMTECMPITSPPANFRLEKPGTSGVAVGPEVAVLNLYNMQSLPPGEEGSICVRGEPCFRGYCMDHSDNNPQVLSTFLEGGWFDTGDLGYMDSDGYLYITGRSKEVINRGGEIISPMEVEEAVGSHPSVQACVAFSATHNVLQEVVGIVIVPVPGRPKVDLHFLHEYLGQERLAAAKWPQCIVFMDGLPKSHTNKLLRVKLGQRLNLPELNDGMYPIERTFQAKCPPQGTPLETLIPCEQVTVHAPTVQSILRAQLVTSRDQDLVVVPHPSRIGALVAYTYNMDRIWVVQVAREKLDNFVVPTHICQMNRPFVSMRDLLPPRPADSVAAIVQEQSEAKGLPVDPLVREIQELCQDLLDLDCHPAPETNFFNMGGSSMLASQLASKIRKRYDIPFSGAEVFHHASCGAMGALIRERRGANGHSAQDPSVLTLRPDGTVAPSLSAHHKDMDMQGAAFDSKRIMPEKGLWRTLFQLVPLFVLFPLWQMTRFFLFFLLLLQVLKQFPGDQTIHILAFIATLVAYHLVWVTFTPLIFVAIKWIVIGEYQQGRYAIWSNYYLRWWFVDNCRKLIGLGIWGSTEPMLNAYYRLLGAKVGVGARISLAAEIAEFDLVTIGERAFVEFSTVRAFGVDNGCIILGPVTIGNHASVGVRSVVAPFTIVPDGAHLGPVSSSYEKGANMAAKHERYNRRALPEPRLSTQLLIGGPIMFFVNTLSHIPSFLVLYWMVSMPYRHNKKFRRMSQLMQWLCDPRRIPFYIGIRVARAIFEPFVYMGLAILVKKLLIGEFKEGKRDTRSEWQLFRHWLAATLFSREKIQDVTELVGRHYELVSVLFRLLGAKVGKRVFWPGHQPIFSGEFDLIEIGDDVVFGSRSTFLCTTTDSAEKIVLCAGSNVADNCVVLPGSVVGKNAVLGSNSLCPEGWYLPEASVWFGARGSEPTQLEKGVESTFTGSQRIMAKDIKNFPMVGDETTIRPFGKAFYKREAPYFVLPLSLIIFFSLLTSTMTAVLHTFPFLGAIHWAAGILYGFPIWQRDYALQYSSGTLYVTISAGFLMAHVIRVLLWAVIELAAKWTFMGRREEGRFNYDTCNYAQNWELYQIVTRIRRVGRTSLLDFIEGTPFMATFFKLQGCKLGKDCCLYPTGGDPYMPEPDLVEMGDRCVVDTSSIVSHLNTRGNFELVKIILEHHVTLRARSRVQQGVHMEAGSMLLEKSLAMTGEVIDADSVWQGAPATRLFSYEHELGVRPSTSHYESVVESGAEPLDESGIV